jgi:(2R)-3-sulfolactate dehydrogenase (NADP+)
MPRVTRATPSVIRVDAQHGFAYPAIAAGLQAVVDAVAQTGVGVVTIGRSHHSGVAGHHVEDLASRGLLALMFTNNSARISAPGGRRPRFGMNPIAFACPRPSKPPLVVDLSMTVVAAGKIVMAARQGDPIPAGWAYDAQGEPTCDPTTALPHAGSVSGFGYKRIASPRQPVDATGSRVGRTATPLRRVERRPASAGAWASLQTSFGAARPCDSICGVLAGKWRCYPRHAVRGGDGSDDQRGDYCD